MQSRGGFGGVSAVRRTVTVAGYSGCRRRVRAVASAVVCPAERGDREAVSAGGRLAVGRNHERRPLHGAHRVHMLLPDKPGELVRTAKTVADAQGNVIKLEHNQFVSTNRNAAVELRLTIEAFGTEHKHEIMQALEDEGLRPREIGAKLY